MKDEIQGRVSRNLDRVRALVRTYDSIRGAGQGRRDVQKSDVLRAAVVFLHATLEDFLRSLEQWKMPGSGEAVLNEVPLAGQKGRAEKFYLGRLDQHRGKTVDQLIDESVAGYLQHTTYNNADELAGTLTRVGVNPQLVSVHFAKLEDLMVRRHNIVHRADENVATGRGHFRAKTISMATVNGWIEVVDAFTTDTLAQL